MKNSGKYGKHCCSLGACKQNDNVLMLRPYLFWMLWRLLTSNKLHHLLTSHA